MIYRISLTHWCGDQHVAASLAEASAMLEAGWQFVSMRGYSERGSLPDERSVSARCSIRPSRGSARAPVPELVGQA